MIFKQTRAALPLAFASTLALNYPNVALAQTNPPVSASSPGSGLINDWLREQAQSFDVWDVGGQFRGRFEHKEYFAVASAGKVDFQKSGDADNIYGLFRERFHLGYMPCAWFSVFGEFQDSSAVNDDRNPSPDNDHYQLRQAWVKLGNVKEFPFTATVSAPWR